MFLDGVFGLSLVLPILTVIDGGLPGWLAAPGLLRSCLSTMIVLFFDSDPYSLLISEHSSAYFISLLCLSRQITAVLVLMSALPYSALSAVYLHGFS